MNSILDTLPSRLMSKGAAQGMPREEGGKRGSDPSDRSRSARLPAGTRRAVPGAACPPARSPPGIVLWEIVTGEAPVRGQMRDVM